MKTLFFLCFAGALLAQPPQATSVSPGYGTGLAATLTFRVAAPAGWNDFENMFITLRPATSNPLPFTNGCDLNYLGGTTPGLILLNDAGTNGAQFVLEGQSVQTVSGQTNSYCSIVNAPTHTAFVNGVFTFTISLAFKNPMVGLQEAIFTDGLGYQSGESGFASFQPGWTVNTVQIASMTSPAPGSRLTGTSFRIGLTPSTYTPKLLIGTYPGGSDVWQGFVTNNQNISGLPDTMNFGGAPLSTLYLTLSSPTDSNNSVVTNYSLLPAPVGVLSLQYPVPASPAIYVTDDYSGGTVQIPTSDNPYVNPDVYISPDQELVSLGSYYNLIIEHARPNSSVWALQTNGDLLYTSAPDPSNPGTTPSRNWCPAWPNFPSGSNGRAFLRPTGACMLGVTDGTGYFASAYVASPIPGNVPILGDTYTKVWVGPITPDPSDPSGTTSIQTNDALFVGSVYFFIQDSTGNPPFSTFSAGRRKAHTLTLANGKRLEISAPAKISVAGASSVFNALDSGQYQYDFSVDTRTAQVIRIGRDLRYRDHAEAAGAPAGWLQTKVGLFALPESERSASSKVSLISDWKPGPIPLYFQGKHEPFPIQETSADNIALARATSILRTATQKVVIGPAIKPGISRADLRLLVRDWRYALGFSFLAPLLDSSDLKAGIELLKPGTDMERSIVQCLRDAI